MKQDEDERSPGGLFEILIAVTSCCQVADDVVEQFVAQCNSLQRWVIKGIGHAALAEHEFDTARESEVGVEVVCNHLEQPCLAPLALQWLEGGAIHWDIRCGEPSIDVRNRTLGGWLSAPLGCI